MTCVYLLMSESDPTQRYIGFTDDPKAASTSTTPDAPLIPQNSARGNSLLILPSRIVTMPWRLNVSTNEVLVCSKECGRSPFLPF
jgi:hypothetical protein